MTLQFDEADVNEARRFNAWLAWTPRARVRTCFDLALIQGALAVAGRLSARRLRRSGLSVENRRVSALGRSVDVRIIRPQQGQCRGVYLTMHGGGWAVGIPAMDDPVNARIARECGVAVVSVGYRRVPRHPISAAIDDCETVFGWLFNEALREFGTKTIFVGGELAGAHLAACVVMRVRKLEAVAGVVLLYGIYDLAGSESLRRAGRETLVLHGPTLAPSLDWLMASKTMSERREPSISPLYADLEGLPPALLMVGTGDPLIDDSVRFAARWNASNRNAEIVVVPEAPHAFNRFRTRIASKTNAYVDAWLNRRLAAIEPKQIDPMPEILKRSAERV